MSKGLLSPRRLAVSTALAMIASMFVLVGPAYADPTCAVSATDATVLNVTLVTDSTTALRVDAVEGNLEFAEGPTAITNPPTGFADCPGGALAAIDRININGSGAGNETVRIIADSNWDGTSVVNFVDLLAGNDTLNFTQDAAGDTLEVGLSTGPGGVELADLTENGEGDVQINNAETVNVTGLDAADFVDAFDSGDAGQTQGAHSIPGSTASWGRDLTFTAGAGNDFFVSGPGNDTYLGGAGDDSIDYSSVPSAVEVDLTAGTSTGGGGNDTLTDVQIVFGSDFDDTLLGSAVNNGLFGNDGDDIIDGLAGDDDQFGGNGDDTLLQGAAADGADELSGGADTDEVDYSARTTDLYVNVNDIDDDGAGGCPLGTGCEDDDVQTDVEVVATGTGNDTLVGTSSAVRWIPGAGNDNVTGDGDDEIDFRDSAAGVTVDVRAGTATGEGDDTFTPTTEDWSFRGSAFDDTFIDNTDQDNGYIARAGNDVFDQSADPEGDEVEDIDTFDGGDGDDTLDYSQRTADLNICLNGENTPAFACDPANNGEGVESDDVVDDIENANGGSGDDAIDGNESANVLTGNLGNDTMFGDAGNDSFSQGAAPDGSDSITGGGGADTVDYSLRTGNVRVTLSGGGNQGEAGEGDDLVDLENAMTGAGRDLLVGNAVGNILSAGGGRDLVNGAGGEDQMDGQAGRDRVSYATGVGVTLNLKNGTGAETGGGFDTVTSFANATGSRFSDIIIGTNGRNRLRGLAGGDTIKAAGGRDNLKGDQGRDVLNGGKGRDRGNGGPGRDRCRKVEVRISC